MTTKITINQIAAAAGVSIATVSRVLNHSNTVKSKTMQKVLDAMQALEYDFQEFLPHEKSGSPALLLLNIPSMSNPFYSDVIKGAQAAAARYGYYLLINAQHINDGTFNAFLDILKNIRVTGLIILNALQDKFFDALKSKIPFVQCCEYTENQNEISYTSIDDNFATRKMMDYILSTGHKKIALLSGPMRYKYARHRKQGYLQSLATALIQPPDDWMIQLPEIDFDMALTATTRMLSAQNPPNAIFTVSDVYAAAAIKAASLAGLEIPRDIIITGFDNVDISQTTNPSITTISQPKYQLGYTACELLIEKLQNPQILPQQILLNTELIIRESTVARHTQY